MQTGRTCCAARAARGQAQPRHATAPRPKARAPDRPGRVAGRRVPRSQSSSARSPPVQRRWRLQPDLAEIDTRAQMGLGRFLAPPFRGNLDNIRARLLIEPIKFEIAIVVARCLRDRSAVLDEANARALNAIDRAVRLRRERAADEAFRVAPEIAVIDAGTSAQLRFHHVEVLFARNARHFLVLDLDRAHGAGRARLLAAGLLPALVEEMGVERPDLREPQVLIPPDVTVGR